MAELAGVEQQRAPDGRDGEQEAQLEGLTPSGAQEEGGGDRHARAADAGHECEGLGRAHEQDEAHREGAVEGVGLAVAAPGGPKDERRHGPSGRHEPQALEQPGRAGGSQAQARSGGGQGPQHRDRQRPLPRTITQQAQPGRGQSDEDGQQGRSMQEHEERLAPPARQTQVEQLRRGHEVARGADGQELGQSLQDGDQQQEAHAHARCLRLPARCAARAPCRGVRTVPSSTIRRRDFRTGPPTSPSRSRG